MVVVYVERGIATHLQDRIAARAQTSEKRIGGIAWSRTFVKTQAVILQLLAEKKLGTKRLVFNSVGLQLFAAWPAQL